MQPTGVVRHTPSYSWANDSLCCVCFLVKLIVSRSVARGVVDNVDCRIRSLPPSDFRKAKVQVESENLLQDRLRLGLVTCQLVLQQLLFNKLTNDQLKVKPSL